SRTRVPPPCRRSPIAVRKEPQQLRHQALAVSGSELSSHCRWKRNSRRLLCTLLLGGPGLSCRSASAPQCQTLLSCTLVPGSLTSEATGRVGSDRLDRSPRRQSGCLSNYSLIVAERGFRV